jgi:transporter family-2 protein
LAALNGILGTVSRLVNAALGTYVGSLESSWINHVVGSLVAGALLLAGWRTGVIRGGLPWYYWTGGCMGVLVVAAGNYVIPRIGAVLFALLVLAMQLVSSAALDHFGVLGGQAVLLSPQRAIGLLILFFGAVLALAERKSARTGAADE